MYVVYAVYECTSSGPSGEPICQWVWYDRQTGDPMKVGKDGKWYRRPVHPDFGPWYYWEIDTDGDGVPDMACGFFYDPWTGGFRFGCQIIF